MWIIGTGLLLVHDVNEPQKEGYMPRVGPNVHFCQVSFLIVPGFPAIKPGDDLAGIVLKTFPDFQDGDVLVIAQKIVSKAEGRLVRLSDITPSEAAVALAANTGRDPRYCQLVLDESTRIVEVKGKVIVVEHKTGTICTSAGIDKSNLEDADTLLLLPINSDKSAEGIRVLIESKTGKRIAVIVNDSGGSPYRQGAIGEAIGFSGIKALYESKTKDLFGNPCAPSVNVVDQLSATASLLMGEAGEGTPVIVIRGVSFQRDENAKLRDILISA